VNLQAQELTPTNNDANQATAAGWYQLATGALNAPPISAYYHLQVFNMYGNQLRQIAYQISTEWVYTRRYDTSAWTPWQLASQPYDTAWTNLPLVAGSHYGAPYGPGQYRKNADGMVVMQGLVIVGSPGVVHATMPVGYRPTASRDLIFGGACSISVPELVRIDGTGSFRTGAAVTSGSWISLTDITYLAEG